jgi:transposase
MGTRRVFTREFKLEAVKLVSERGVRVAQAARDLGIGENVLSRWVREAASGKGSAFPGCGVMKAEDAELAQLRRELARTKAERDILKKPSPSLPRIRREVCVYRQASRDLADAA